MTDKPDEQEYAKERVYTAEEIAKSCKRMAELNHVPVSQVLAFLHPAAVSETVSPAPDKALPEPPKRNPSRSCEDQLQQMGEYADALRQRAERLQHQADTYRTKAHRRSEIIGELQSALTAERQKNEGLARDAERWREHSEVQRMARLPGALHVLLRMQPEASGTDQICQTEYVFDTLALGQNTILGLKAIGMSVEKKAQELFDAIDAARSRQGAGQ